jgi:thioredoxin-dependent peroxiredoxin
MNKILIGAVLASFVALPALADLQPGAMAPDFNAPASLDGKTLQFSLSETLKKGPVVVYFFPGAYTSGCNLQAHTFAANYDKFTAAGATVVGVSLDNIERLNEFSADPEYCAGKFATVSDADGKIAKAYDLEVAVREGAKDTQGRAIDHGFAERSTFVVTPDSKVAFTIGGVAPVANVEAALKAVEGLTGKSGR